MKGYTYYDDVKREHLDSVEVGDLIVINDWKRGMRVKAVSEHYILIHTKCFDDHLYSVISKAEWDGNLYNSLRGGMFYAGPDNLVFGYMSGYDFDDKERANKYLKEFEEGKLEISLRRGVAIQKIGIKKGKVK